MGLTPLGCVLMLALVVYLAACDRRINECEPIGALARSGFARAAGAPLGGTADGMFVSGVTSIAAISMATRPGDGCWATGGAVRHPQ